MNNFVGAEEQLIVATEDVPNGESLILSASFDEKEGMEPTCATGTLSLYHGDVKVGEGRARDQLGAFSIAGSGLLCGTARRRVGDRRLPGRAAVRFHRRDDPTGSRWTSAASRTSTSSARPMLIRVAVVATLSEHLHLVERHADPASDRRLRGAGDWRRAGPTTSRSERIAVFDNDGTLWCEKPMPIELGFILQRLAAMAADHETLREAPTLEGRARKRPRLARRGDHQALPRRRHRRESPAGRHRPGLRRHERRRLRVRPTSSCAPASTPRSGGLSMRWGTLPMVELLRYLEANGFTNYIASGGDRDFMRPITEQMYCDPA